MNRRDFLHTVGGAAVAGGALSAGLDTVSALLAAPGAPRVRVAVLWQRGFPTINAAPTSESVIQAALADCAATFLGGDELLAELHREPFDVLLLPYGSAFPRAAWPAIRAFLDAGGHWVNLGGVPLARPLRFEGYSADVIQLPWRTTGVDETTFHRAVGITQAFRVAVPATAEWESPAHHPWASSLIGQCACANVQELYVRFSKTKRVPDEDGSDGIREAVLEPLVSAIRADASPRTAPLRVPVAAPVVLIDRQHGTGTGGRWVFYTGDGSVTPAGIRTMVAAAAMGCVRLALRPSNACFVAEDVVSVTSTLERPAPVLTGTEPTLTLDVFDRQGVKVGTAKGPLPGAGPTVARTDTFPVTKPGYYRVDATLAAASDVVIRATTGFWIADETPFAATVPLTADAFGLHRGDRPFPVTGTTYMASDVHRQFLFEPNPDVWMRDFAAMKRAGVNVVRTGIWTGWSHLMTPAGALNEPALRALDAFMLTAAHHGIAVVFTFFAFVPPMWGGLNPYLDPSAVRAQKKFVTTIVSRYRTFAGVTWDLINEPSFCAPANLWVTRPNGDAFEKREWVAWLDAHVPASTKGDRELLLQERWRGKPGEEMTLPAEADFVDGNLAGGRASLKAQTYRVFAQDLFRRWVREIAGAARAAAGPGQLITVGQDEGGTGERPSNQFFGAELDVTSIHTWWYNDDLLWDSIVSKHPAKPNLVQETGVMFYETADGRPWRTEDAVRDVFERKLALAIGAGGAGFINWIWNTNPYMPSDNEAAIGLFRPDGTAKPEFDAWRGVTEFVAGVSERLEGRERERALLVIPQANLFSTRTTAAEATKRAVRTMCYRCGMPMAAVGEFNIRDWPDRPPLIVLPSPRILSSDAWNAIWLWVSEGSTLLVTGPFDEDEHWVPTLRMQQLGLPAQTRPVAATEWVNGDQGRVRLSFRGEKLHRVETATGSGRFEANSLVLLPLGKGHVWWTGIPLELAEENDFTVGLYRAAIKQAGLMPPVSVVGADEGAALVWASTYRTAVLYTVISEAAGQQEPVTFKTAGTAPRTITVRVPPGRAALVLADRATGAIVADYPRGAASTSELVTQG